MPEIIFQFLCILYTKDTFPQVELELIFQHSEQKYNLSSFLERLESEDFKKGKEQIKKQNKQLFVMILNSTSQLINSLKNLMSPYLYLIIHILYITDNQQQNLIHNFFEKLAQTIETRVLLQQNILDLAPKLSSSSVKKASHLILNIFKHFKTSDVDAFQQESFKKYLKFLDYTRTELITQEPAPTLNLDEIEKPQIEALGTLVLKLNDSQMRKMFLNFVTWAEKKFPESETPFITYRKIILAKFVNNVFDKLASLFTEYFTFVFDGFILNLQESKEVFWPSTQPKNKRSFTPDDLSIVLLSKQTTLIVQAFENLFKNDGAGFVDTQKLESLTNPIFDLLEALNFPKFPQFVQDTLSKCIVSLFNLITDDYKLKTLNYNLMMRSRNENVQVKIAILSITAQLIDTLQERYLVLTNDILPFVSEMLDDVNQEVEVLSKNIIIKLEQVSGQNIREFLKMK